MPDIRDPEMYSLITIVYKPPKNFVLPETKHSLKFVWFEDEFPCFCYSLWEDVAYCLSCISFDLVRNICEVLVRKIFTKRQIKYGQQQ